MRLAIADPPYPPLRGSGGTKNRSSRWYGDKQRSATDRAADTHAAAGEWDDEVRHRELLEQLVADYDGWAIATSPDGIAAYGPLPVGARIMAWLKPNACPGSHRLLSMWEPVILYPPEGRRSNRGGGGSLPDVLTCRAPRIGFPGAKPPEWTRWVLDALGYDPALDTVDDLFPGSGSVTNAIAQDPLFQAKAVAVAEQCRTFGRVSGAPWFVENPVSVLSSVFGKADHTFNPHDYTAFESADNYTKKTCLWTGGGFVMPPPARDLSLGEPDDRIHKAPPSAERANFRSATPMGFARAVFQANVQAVEAVA